MTTTSLPPAVATERLPGGAEAGPRRARGTSASDAAVLAEVDAVIAGMVRLAEVVGDAATWSGDVRRTMLDRLDRVVDGFAAVRAAVLVAERECGTWEGSGDRSLVAWRARTGRAGERSAAAQVRQAEQLASVPTVAAAVTDGRIGMEHAAVIAKVASAGTPAQQVAASRPEGQQRLVALAQQQDAGTFAMTVARWASAIDPDALEADHQAHRRERFLHLSDTPRGTFLKGRLDTMAGHRLRLALEALSPRPAVDDDRDAGQRSADALDALASRILAQADTKPGGHVPPQISMIVSEETWVAARAERDRRRAAGAARTGGSVSASRPGDGNADTDTRAVDDADAGRVSYPPATLEDGTPVPVSELAVAMCDCEITRIVTDADGVPLDLGRTQRLFTREQRRAVIARDRECVWPDCHAHARWCDVHHIAWWERDVGPTSIDNGALLCSFHHHEVHRRDLVITRRVTESTAGPPPSRERRAPVRARGAVALVIYEIRDRSGRLTGEPSHPVTDVEPLHPTIDIPELRARESTSRVDGDPEPDRFDLGWTTDPLTGARSPAFLLSG